MAQIVLLAIVSIGLYYLANRFFGPKAPRSPLDTATTTLAERGSTVPLILGRVRTGYVFCWAGDRFTVQKSSGGGKGGGGSKQKRTIYHESGWHAICVGPAYRLHVIRKGSGNIGISGMVAGFDEFGKVILDGSTYPLTREDNPSGSTITSKMGSFDVYWGECDQPSNTHLGGADRVGITSRWPYFCYVVWNPAELGEGSARWPLIDYEVEVRIEGSALVDSAAWIEESTEGAGDDGVNPAHALWQLLTATSPHGLAIDPERLDKQSFEDLGTLCADEHIPVNIRAGDATEGAQVVANLLQHCGAMIPQIADQLVAVGIRAVSGSLPVLTTDVVRERPIESEVNAPQKADRLLFVYPDRKNLYKEMDYIVDDDSLDTLSRTERRIEMPYVTSQIVAQTVIDRKQAESFADLSASSVRVAREGRRLEPGQVFTLDGENHRVVSVKLEPDPSFALVEFIPDLLSPPPTGHTITEQNPATSLPSGDIAADVAFRPIELPYRLSPVGIQTLSLLRLRGDRFVEGAVVNVSPDGVSYSDIGQLGSTHNGGTLLEPISVRDLWIIDEGPTFTLDSIDVDDVLDLSGDDARWRAGAQLCLIGDEVFFLRSITALGGSTYRLDGLIRARFDTIPRAHAVGDRIWILAAVDLARFTSEAITAGVDLRVKSQPFNAVNIIDLTTITAETLSVVDRALRPIAPSNWRANDRLADGRRNIYDSGDDIAFAWSHRIRDGAGAAAGEQVAGTPIFEQATLEGFIRITIEEIDGTVVRTINVTDGSASATYANATMAADFGGEPEFFVARIRNMNGARSSEARTIVVSQHPGVDLLVDSSGNFLVDESGAALRA